MGQKNLAMQSAKPLDPEVEAEISGIATSSIAVLRDRWQTIFKNEPPPAFGPDLLRRAIAYRLQEQAYEGLPFWVRGELNRLITTISKTPGGRIALPRRIKVGAILIREWKGKTYRVTVVDGGFLYGEKKYMSLSEIAREITGARWNGPRFFGLRKSTLDKEPKRKGWASEVGAGF